jgi:hypothetical protein
MPDYRRRDAASRAGRSPELRGEHGPAVAITGLARA